MDNYSRYSAYSRYPRLPKKKPLRKRPYPWMMLVFFTLAFLYAWFFYHPDQGLRGIDVSRYQTEIDWQAVADDGVKFAFIKATEGLSWVDPMFERNWKQSADAGIARGAYHFYRPGKDPEAQAKHFSKVYLEAGTDLPPVLDLEVTDGYSAKVIREGALAWMKAVEESTGQTPILYTMPRYAASYLDQQFLDYPLWVVDLGYSGPELPPGYKKWDFWQYSHTGSVDGIQGDVDLNFFNGSAMQLLSLRKK